MAVSAAQFQTKILQRQRAPEEYRVYRAALQWGLMDPIVIASRADFKSEPYWRDKLEPFHQQVKNLITFCRRLPATLLADDVGLRRTITAGLVASELIARSRMSKMLIVCPKLLASQWQDELQAKFNIPAKIAMGKELINTEPEDVGAVITTYGSAHLWLDRIPDDRFEMLVLDEAHTLRNLYGGSQPSPVAKHFRDMLNVLVSQLLGLIVLLEIIVAVWQSQAALRHDRDLARTLLCVQVSSNLEQRTNALAMNMAKIRRQQFCIGNPIDRIQLGLKWLSPICVDLFFAHPAQIELTHQSARTSRQYFSLSNSACSGV